MTIGVPQNLGRNWLWGFGAESGSPAIVVPQHAAESLTTDDLTGCARRFLSRLNQSVAQPLVVSFCMIMGNELLSGVAQGTFTEENHTAKAFFFYGSHETFEMCREIR